MPIAFVADRREKSGGRGERKKIFFRPPVETDESWEKNVLVKKEKKEEEGGK